MSEDNTEPDIWVLRSGYYECWPSWSDENVVSVGWPIGCLRDLHEEADTTSESKSKIKEKLDEKHDMDKHARNSAAGTIRTVAGIRGSDRNFQQGDYVIILGKPIRGESVIHGVAELKKYRYDGDKTDVKEDAHPYVWDVNFCAKGSVYRSDLEEEFDGSVPKSRQTLIRKTELGQEFISAIKDAIDNCDTVDITDEHFTHSSIDEADLQRYISEHQNKLDSRLDQNTLSREVSVGDDARIDFRGKTPQDDLFLVEVKAETASTKAVDQLDHYKNKADSNRPDSTQIISMLVAPDFNEAALKKAAQKNFLTRQVHLEARFEDVDRDVPTTEPSA
ncbi:PDDEXK family nuclease [Halorussus salinus]|uniref:endonuclease NucS domain-containing protein n=1 Tax=Halorussus salinus TaxID=1364935 RepID=UPI001092A90A|nr:endonuclease NucS domain-containing protein [Halorussus salinus]